MFVIVYNNSVILGPMRWNRYRFQNEILEECEFSVTLPDSNTTNAIVVSNDIKILPVEGTQNPAFNSKIEFLNGPFWEFTDTKAICSFEVQSYKVDAVKNQLFSLCAAERWKKESLGVKINLQGLDVTIDTARGNRDILIQKYLLLNETDVIQWKFSEGWLGLTKTDLGEIVAVINKHVQDQFDWELAKIDEINACETLEQLDAVIITDLVPLEVI